MLGSRPPALAAAIVGGHGLARPAPPPLDQMPRLGRSNVRLDRLATEVAEHVRALAEEKGIKLDASGLTECCVQGDADALRRLLFNLLENAVKYTQKDGKVTLELNSHNGHAEII